ncbi:hypothetical protein KML24007_04410 [Alistipes indistinctus]
MLASPAFSQSFLDRALKKVDKTLDAADKFLNGEKDKTQEQTTATQQSQSQPQQEQVATENPTTDLAKANLRGKVKSVAETELWDEVERKSFYEYNPVGMIERYETEDGVMECSYTDLNGKDYIVSRKITLSGREYASLTWNGETYMDDIFQQYYDHDGIRSMRESIMYPKIKGIPEDVIIYSYLDGGKVVKADKTSDRGQFVPSFYVYDEKGRLVAEYSEDMDGVPVRELKYDANGRMVYEKDPSGVVSQYAYNDNGDMSLRKITNTFEEDEDSESMFTYRYDSQGNWIEKTWISNGETVCTYKRTIEYYQ